MSEAPYRMPGPTPPTHASPPGPPDAWLQQWRRVRKWRVVAACTFVGLLSCPVLSVLLYPHLGRWAGWLVWPIVPASVITNIGLCWLACPRCRDAFAQRQWWEWSPRVYFRRACLHCGLRFGTPKHPA